MSLGTEEIIRALGCCSSVHPNYDMCETCPYSITEEREGVPITACDVDRVGKDAADRLESLIVRRGAR